MPCSDSSSSISIKLDPEENFISFEYAKITCGQGIDGKTGLSDYFTGKALNEIIETSFQKITNDLDIKEEDSQFILYMEWDALRSAVAQYLGIENPTIDKDRCRITSIEHTEEGIEVAEVILPPKELPKILPCSLTKKE